MDCRHAAEILSAARDGENVPTGALASARSHARACAECAAFEATAERMDALTPPRAPQDLVARIIAGAAADADARADARATEAHVTPIAGVSLPRREPRTGRTSRMPAWWRPQFTALASAAAVVLLVGAASSVILGQMAQTAGDMKSADLTSTYGETSDGAAERFAAAPESSTATTPAYLSSGATNAAAAAAAPPYVSWSGGVWTPSGATAPQPSDLTSAGVLVSDLGEPSGARERAVLVRADDPLTIFVTASDGALVGFSRVVRGLGRHEYALVTDTPLQSYGTWPALPSRFTPPSAPDGSPTFIRQGFDDLSVDAYGPADLPITDGFAVAPGTSAADPAAGNPNWTWWERID